MGETIDIHFAAKRSSHTLLANHQTEVRPYDTFPGVSNRDEQDNAIAKMPEEF